MKPHNRVAGLRNLKRKKDARPRQTDAGNWCFVRRKQMDAAAKQAGELCLTMLTICSVQAGSSLKLHGTLELLYSQRRVITFSIRYSASHHSGTTLSAVQQSEG
jgi:hypothetical protein